MEQRVDAAVTFLGKLAKSERNPYGYALTSYTHDGELLCESPFVAHAVYERFRPARLYVVSTAEGLAAHYADLCSFVPDIVPLPIEIAAPTDDTDIWKIFSQITSPQYIHPGERIVFDVTNSFRSIPILSFLASSYLRVIRDVQLVALTYAEFDPTRQGATPLRDVSIGVQLLDWIAATDAFLKYGRADTLTALMRRSPDFVPLAERIEQLTAALQTSRPSETLAAAHQLPGLVADLQANAAAVERPITLLFDRITAEYAPLGHSDPTSDDHTLMGEVVAKHFEMVLWYRDHGMAVQALTLAREWLVSFVISQSTGALFDQSWRFAAEAALNGYRRTKGTPQRPGDSVPEAMFAAAQRPAVCAAWGAIRLTRNDVGHTGMQQAPRAALAIIAQVGHVCTALQTVWEERS